MSYIRTSKRVKYLIVANQNSFVVSLLPNRIMFSRACSYGIQASLYLAREASSGELVPAHKIAADLHVPFHFLKPPWEPQDSYIYVVE